MIDNYAAVYDLGRDRSSKNKLCRHCIIEMRHYTSLHVNHRDTREIPSSFVLLHSELLRGTTRTKIKTGERENEAKDCNVKLITN